MLTLDPAKQLAAAQADLGYHEVGSNCQKYSFWQSGVWCQYGGWCVSAASKWAYDGGFRFGADAPFGDRGFNGTWGLEAWAHKHGLARTRGSYTARPGDLFCVNGAAHTATVVLDRGIDYERTHGAPRFLTIDGNTSDRVAYRERWANTCELLVALTVFATAPSPTVKQIVAQQQVEVTVNPIVIPTSAVPNGDGTIPYYELLGDHVLAHHGAKLKWHDPNADYSKPAKMGNVLVYKIPIRKPYTSMEEKYEREHGTRKVLTTDVAIVTASNGGVTYFDFLLP